MNFSTAQAITSTIDAGNAVERVRSANRTLVDSLFGGFPSLSDSEAKQWGLQINVNWGEGPILDAQARRQYTNAFEKPNRFFRLTVPTMPEEMKTKWQMAIEQFINRKMKDDDAFMWVRQYVYASVVSHGIGPTIWEDKEKWVPRFVGLKDFRVPTDTEISFRDLPWFAIRDYYTEYRLSKAVFGPDADEGWNKPLIANILDQLHGQNYSTTTDTWNQNPERMLQLMKENGGFFDSDAAPTVSLWRFYFRHRNEETGEESWRLRVVVDTQGTNVSVIATEFLYDSGETPIAEKLSELMWCQFGDLNNVAPFMFHAVRSLGFLLVEPCFWSNVSLCRTLQYLMESFNVWIGVTDPAGEDRAQSVEFFDKCIVPQGVRIIPQNERHQVNAQLIEQVMGRLKQLQGEASSSYTQQADTGTSREQTAYETSVKVAQVNAMTSGMLLMAFRLVKKQYREICRRFCLRGSSDPDVREFQKSMKRQGIPEEFLNVDLWEIEPEVPLGSGNPTMEMSQAQQLGQIAGQLSPEAQQKVLFKQIASITGSWSDAQDLVPLNTKPVADDGMKWVSAIFGTLMQGVPVPQNQSVSALQQAEPMLGMMAGVIARIEQNGNLATAGELTGLHTVEGYIGMLIQQIGQAKVNSEAAQKLSRDLGQLSNILKGFDQRLAQKQQADAEKESGAGSEQAKLAMEAQAQQVQQQLDAKRFQQDEVRKTAAFQAEQHRKDVGLAADLARKHAETDASVTRSHVETGAAIANESAKTDATVEATKKKAEAMPKAKSE